MARWEGRSEANGQHLFLRLSLKPGEYCSSPPGSGNANDVRRSPIFFDTRRLLPRLYSSFFVIGERTQELIPQPGTVARAGPTTTLWLKMSEDLKGVPQTTQKKVIEGAGVR